MGIDLSSLPTTDLDTLLSVVRNSVRLSDVELSAGQTFTVLRSLSTITEGLYIDNNVELHTETLENLQDFRGEVRGRFVVCWGDSAVRYRDVLQRWAAILGWQSKDVGNFFEISIGVFHGVAGVARATPGLMELPSTGKVIEVNR